MKTLLLSLLVATSVHANVDLAKSSFKWTGSKVTESHFGNVSLKSADLKVKEGKITDGNFVMDLNTLKVKDLSGSTADKLLGHLKSGDFLEVEKYPTATLKLTKVTDKTMTGKLTIKGKTETVTFPYTKKGNKLTGTMKFDRTKFGIIYNSGNFFKDLGDKLIKDEVTLDFNVKLKKS